MCGRDVRKKKGEELVKGTPVKGESRGESKAGLVRLRRFPRGRRGKWRTTELKSLALNKSKIVNLLFCYS